MTPYNNYYQNPYMNTPYNPYQPNMPQISQMQTGQQPQPQPQPQMQIQNGGFVSVRSIEDAQRYAVAPGNAVTFKIEGAPIVCEKSQGFSQLEAPHFKVFDLVERETSGFAPQGDFNNQPINNTPEPLKAEIQAINAKYEGIINEVNKLWETVNALSVTPEPKPTATKTKSTAKNTKEGEEV